MKNDEYLKDKLTPNQIKKINNSEDFLMSQIDTNNNVEVEKVERYINLLKLFYALDVYIEQSGPITIVKNASQEFVKANPAIAEKNKVSGSLLALEKSFQLDKKAEQKRLEEAAKGPDLT
ncbi:hypothetical protein WL766_06365 [Staphylococcus pasteuri]|nr:MULTISPECIES: hypothetical protein [Staphylococcus]ODB42688.1 hypothetical protein A9N02_10945 [Staphylococcus sp. AOAB]RQX27075.1 hypothetical protein DB792_09505 [Staphylococcus warneri]MBM6506688.1 hypothetical protein [Staphylococcus pasteuri]MCO0861857.1 hypothetical protein [Staphylococcus pasteuri]MCO5360682.1 hypothetical protein [Staphylococcus pasteuri]